MRVFRDISSLAATAGLMSEIEGVLRETRYLILLASPRAAKSQWVAREVNFWCENKSSATLLIALTEGDVKWNRSARDFDWEKTSALPRILSRRFAEEPLLVDLSWTKDAERIGPRHPGLREATATLAAAIHGRPRDSLIGDDIRRHRHAIQVAVAAALLIVGFAGVATWQYDSARKERDNAVEQARQATSLALSASSGLQLEDHPKTALLLGLEAYKLRPRPEARSALVAAFQVSERTGAGPILRRHTDIARDAAFSPNGQKLVSVGDDRVVRVWDTRRREEVEFSPLRGHRAIVMAVDVSPDGRAVASGSWDGTVRLWDIGGDGGTVLRRGARVDSLAFSPRRAVLAVASGPDVEIWAYRDKEKLGTYTAEEDVEQVTFNDDGRLVAGATGVAGNAFMWELATGTSWSLHHGGIAGAVGFSEDGQTLVVGGAGEGTEAGGTVSLWDVRSHQIIGRRMPTGTDLVRGVALAGDGRTLFAAGQEGSVARIDTQQARVVGELPDVSEGEGIWGLATDRDREVLAIPASDGTVRMWDVGPPRPFGSPLDGSDGDVMGIAVSPHGQLVAAAHEGGTIDLWDAGRGQLLQTLEEHTKGVTAVEFLPSGKTVVFAAGGHIHLWEPDSGEVTTMRRRIPPVFGLAVSGDGERVASAELGGRVRLWDLRARSQVGAPIKTSDTSPLEVSFVALSSDGKAVAFAAGDYQNQEIRLVDAETGDIVGSTGGIWPLDSGAISPGGTVRAASIKWPHVTLATVAPTSKQRIRVGDAGAAELSPDGGTLLVGGEDGRVRAWDAVELKPLGSPFGGDSSRVNQIAFSADGETYAAAGDNGAVRIWQDVFWGDLGEIEKRVCRDAGSSLPRNEWNLAAPGIPYSASCG